MFITRQYAGTNLSCLYEHNVHLPNALDQLNGNMCNLNAKNVNQLNTRNGKKTKIVTFHTLTKDEKNSDMNTKNLWVYRSNDNLT